MPCPSVEENKVLVRRFFDEVFTRWDPAAVEALLARGYRQHDPVRPAPLNFATHASPRQA